MINLILALVCFELYFTIIESSGFYKAMLWLIVASLNLLSMYLIIDNICFKYDEEIK